MKSTTNFYSKQICKWLLITTMVILGLHLLLQQINLNVFHQQNGYFFELSNRFDLDDEASLPTWFSQALFLLIGAAALLAAKLEKIRIKKVLWSIISVIGLFLSMDEVAGFHEQILQTIHVVFFQESAPTILSNAWLIVLPFVLVLVYLLGKQMIKHFPRRLIITAGIGIGIFLMGAISVDVVTQGLELSELTLEFLRQGIFVAMEEGLELVGAIIVLYAIMEYIEQTYHKQINSSLAALKK